MCNTRHHDHNVFMDLSLPMSRSYRQRLNEIHSKVDCRLCWCYDLGLGIYIYICVCVCIWWLLNICTYDGRVLLVRVLLIGLDCVMLRGVCLHGLAAKCVNITQEQW